MEISVLHSLIIFRLGLSLQASTQLNRAYVVLESLLQQGDEIVILNIEEKNGRKKS